MGVGEGEVELPQLFSEITTLVTQLPELGTVWKTWSNFKCLQENVAYICAHEKLN